LYLCHDEDRCYFKVLDIFLEKRNYFDLSNINGKNQTILHLMADLGLANIMKVIIIKSIKLFNCCKNNFSLLPK
jgi:hypothetical protein